MLPALPSFKLINSQDYPSQYQSLISTLAQNLNNQIQVLYNAFNNGLTFTNNMESTIKTFAVTVNATGTPSSSISITKDQTDTILGLIVVKAVNSTSSTVYPSGGVFVSYTETSTAIIITNVTGLQANQQYNVTILTII
jgi:hypothetical protein